MYQECELSAISSPLFRQLQKFGTCWPLEQEIQKYLNASVAQTLQSEQSGGVSLILCRAPPLERHDKGWLADSISTSLLLQSQLFELKAATSVSLQLTYDRQDLYIHSKDHYHSTSKLGLSDDGLCFYCAIWFLMCYQSQVLIIMLIESHEDIH